MAEVTVIYFAQEQRSEQIRVGSGTRNGRHRLKQHGAYGYKPIAVVPVMDSERDYAETRIHEFFESDRVPDAGKSIYRGERIHDYVAWLLARNYAVQTNEDAAKIPRIPFSIWGPSAERIDEAYRGQLTLISALPAAKRPEMAHDLVHLSSESDEWFTPIEIIEAAREAMGSIDTDPASSYEAQTQSVKATIWYTKDFDGLRTDHPWQGNVWLNPPYGRGEGSAKSFIGRLVDEMATGSVDQAITCLNVASSTANWFGPVWRHASIHLVYAGRPNFWMPNRVVDSSPSKGIILSYFGPSEVGFIRAFAPMGTIVRTVQS